MKNKILLFCGFTLSIILSSCQKDLGLLKPSSSDFFHKYEWSKSEKKFFSLANKTGTVLDTRSQRTPIYAPLLIGAYNEIADQNEVDSFVSKIIYNVGYPLWNDAYIYRNILDSQNIVVIPLVHGDTNIISGLIAVSNHRDEYIINAVTRQEIFDIQNGNTSAKVGFADVMM